jgi:hypothetical protein
MARGNDLVLKGDLLEAALGYAARGWRVFPVHGIRKDGCCTCGDSACASPGKHPRTRHGFKDGSIDPQVILTWWSQWPDANIGIATGADSGIVVLDVDPRHGGESSLEDLQKRLGPLPATLESLTGGGGRHIFFVHPGPGTRVPSRTRLADLSGLDVRGDGGVIVAPPSAHHSGSHYAWPPADGDGTVALAAIPESLLEVMVARSEPLSRDPVHSESGSICKGERNSTLASLAGSMVHRGMSEKAVLAALLEENDERCDPPLEEREVRKIARSISRYEPGASTQWSGQRLSHDETVVATPDDETNGGRPLLDAGDLDLAHITEATWFAIKSANLALPRLFRHGGLIARIEHDDRGRPFIRDLNESAIRLELAQIMRWSNRDKRGNRRDALPPLHVVRSVDATPNPPLPVLERVVSVPVFDPEGVLVTVPGYNPGSRIWYAPPPNFECFNVNPYPQPEEVELALRIILHEVLVDFPFKGPSDRAHAVGAMLLPFVRTMIAGPTPLHVINKPAPGTGGSLLAGAIAFPALGQPLSAMTEGTDEDEWRKRLTAKLGESPLVVLIDNVSRKLASAALSSAISSTYWDDRLLGTAKMAHFAVLCTWMATGNNIQTSSEIARRSVHIRIDTKQDRPWSRDRDSFRHPELLDWMAQEHRAIVWALHTMISTWIARGRPDGVRSLGTFEAWARVIGGILETVGIDGFLANSTDFIERSDVEGDAWRSLVEVWWNTYQNRPVTVAELVNLTSDLLDLGPGNDMSRRVRLGKKLASVVERKFGQYCILRAGSRQGGALWRLESDSDSPVPVGVRADVHRDIPHQPSSTAAGKRLPVEVVDVPTPFPIE